MNARMLPRFMKLIGRLMVKFNIDPKDAYFTPEEQDILQMAKTEYEFYNAGQTSAITNFNAVQESNVKPAGSREILSRKTPSQAAKG